MVEVSEISFFGPRKFYVHDLLRDLAIEKAKEDNFLIVCSKATDEQTCVKARRVTVHHSDNDGLMAYASPNLRSLLCFKGKHPNCCGHKLLKVLSFKTSDFGLNKLIRHEEIEGLSQLKYLQLHSWDMPEIENPVRFIKLISNMKFLQTLDLGLIRSCDLSDFTWEIETLRHAIMPCVSSSSLGPPSGANLRHLQTLYGIKNRDSWDITTLPYLPNLRMLDITITKKFQWEVVVAFFATLKNLVDLSLKGHEIPIKVIDMRGFPFYQHLTSLTYDGKFADSVSVALDAAMFPTHLSRLCFRGFGIQEVHVAVSEKLQYLEVLRLVSYGINEDLKQMRCSAGGFHCLEALLVADFKNLEEWEIEEGAMPMLREFKVSNCPMLRVPLGLKHLTKLRS